MSVGRLSCRFISSRTAKKGRIGPFWYVSEDNKEHRLSDGDGQESEYKEGFLFLLVSRSHVQTTSVQLHPHSIKAFLFFLTVIRVFFNDMPSYCGFDPEKDVGDLSGKVILVTGGELRLSFTRHKH